MSKRSFLRRCARMHTLKTEINSARAAAWLALPMLLIGAIAPRAFAQVSALDAGVAPILQSPDAGLGPMPEGTSLDASLLPPTLESTASDAALEPAPPLVPIEATPPVLREQPVEGAVDVTVRGKTRPTKSSARSADAVTVVDTEVAKRRSADMGEVLARVQGVSLRRSGGLGSVSRFSLNGLYDDQIRFLYDGVPLAYSELPTTVTDVPVNLFESVEIYRGVVPVRFGADALGGALNFLPRQRRTNSASASYQIGSFGMHRATAAAQYHHPESGFVAGASGFLDSVRNDYRVDVDIGEEDGSQTHARVKRFHDRYFGYGAAVELGVVERPWARRLLLRGFLGARDKELQNDPLMVRAFGEANYDEQVRGLTLRYEQPLTSRLDVDLTGGYLHKRVHLLDDSDWVYNWRGERITRRAPERRGEIEGTAHDVTTWQDSGFARAVLRYAVQPTHVLTASFTSNYDARQGDERLQLSPTFDRADLNQHLLTAVSGLEYEARVLPRTRTGPKRRGWEDHAIANVAFVKSYLYRTDGVEVLADEIKRPLDRRSHRFGFGDSARFTLNEWIYLKASYEYAMRVPRVDEVFGNGILIAANPGLKPELSHNANFGPRAELRNLPFGDLNVELSGFLRDTENLIVLLGDPSTQRFAYQNIAKTRAVGVEGELLWTSPGRWVTAHFNPTYNDQRKTSPQEDDASAPKGDRVPSRPYWFASWGAQLRFADLLMDDDALEPFYEGRYVHSFFRAWESMGDRATKNVIAAQTTHWVGLTYTTLLGDTKLASTFEVQNLTDERVFDFYGVQRPGRGYYLKLAAEYK